MPDYRVYCFDGKNRIASGEWIKAADDAAALALVSVKRLSVRCEVWESQRLVGHVPPLETAKSVDNDSPVESIG